MEEQPSDTHCGESVAEGEKRASSEGQEQNVQRDSQFEETLLLLADLVSEDESSGHEQSKQLRKRRASRDLSRPDAKDQDITTPNNKRRKKNKNKSAKSKMVVRPNYFVGIQVSNPEIHRAVRNLQEKIVKLQPALRSTVIPTPMLHITLAVAHLPDPAHVAKAAEVLKESVSVNRELYNNPPICLTFTGVNTFKNQVLFADIEGGESLLRVAGLAQAIEESFEECGLVLASRKSFQPHLTILKLSKDFKLKRKGMFKISPSLYSDAKSMQFGMQVVKGVQLLSMNKPKDANGYYYCSHEETFGVKWEEFDDHSACCKQLPLAKQAVSVPEAESGSRQGLAESIRRHFHGLAAANGSLSPPTVDDLIKMLLLVGAASIGTAFLLRSFASTK